ncbi:hypothetical protein CCYA_CCYA12G3246 [Cyanidiococcus yangmingshanensis]|nr:hypothetical protein CCYA_CCYA12G3246 [Cyanidiococcus yangmingshanensis]
MVAHWVEALVSGLWAAMIAMAVCALIERCGGALGGVLATVPGTITPASVGIWIARQDVHSFRSSMASAPIGLLVNAGFLTCWRFLPMWVSRITLRRTLQLALLVGGSLALWSMLAFPVLSLVSWLRRTSHSIALYCIAMACALLVLLVGLVGTWHIPKAVTSIRPVAWWVHPIRASLAFLAVSSAVWLSRKWPATAGIIAVWPAVFLTSMVALWWSHGDAFQASATFPMILGLWSPMLFCGLVCFFYPWFDVAFGCFFSWLMAVLLGTTPLTFYIRWRQSQTIFSPLPPVTELGSTPMEKTEP